MPSCAACEEVQTMTTKRQVLESAAYLEAMLPFAPEIGLVLGSGL